ncbi:sensor histidine kinase [Spartinivicinus poritis]|uniref:histidine kinase n=1 Tax=Spartinivicinus poritis TaxID=2994640 RepID=A0ABT5U850_9GAMM|nr:ATP-binding protein [Spartinivicinus sp. A2-2]MDE1462548.1 ATP-binding protein [Spartinivicinus sp. A2-2]
MLLSKQKYGAIARRLLIAVVGVSTTIAILTTSVQLGLDYWEDMRRMNGVFQQIKASSVPSIMRSVWLFDEPQIKIQLDAFVQIPEVVYAEIRQDDEVVWKAGEIEADRTLKEEEFELIAKPLNSSPIDLGKLKVVADMSQIYSRLIDKFAVILVSNSIKTAIVAVVILLVFWNLVTRHLIRMSEYLKSTEPGDAKKKLTLLRGPSKENDELDILVKAINDNYQHYASNKHYPGISDNEGIFYKKIGEEPLKQDNSISNALQQQKQDVLVETEKMAALGGLLEGITQDIEHPLTTSKTATKALQNQLIEAEHQCDEESVNKNVILALLHNCQNHIKTLTSNLNSVHRMTANIRRFASGREKVVFKNVKLKEEVEEVVDAVLSQHPTKNINTIINIDEAILLSTYPAAIHQLLINLVTNALQHGFEEGAVGVLKVAAEEKGDTVVLTIADDGKGMDPETLAHIFDPFFTTKVNKGGTGLGMYIVYNIVTQKLQGTIICESQPDKGAKFIISLPSLEFANVIDLGAG